MFVSPILLQYFSYQWSFHFAFKYCIFSSLQWLHLSIHFSRLQLVSDPVPPQLLSSMAEGTRIRGVHEGKLAEMAEELSLNMEHVSKCFGEVNQRIDGLGIRLDKMDGILKSLNSYS